MGKTLMECNSAMKNRCKQAMIGRNLAMAEELAPRRRRAGMLTRAAYLELDFPPSPPPAPLLLLDFHRLLQWACCSQ